MEENKIKSKTVNLNTDEKQCKACKKIKLLTEFYKQANAPKGRASVCKACKPYKYTKKPKKTGTNKITFHDLKPGKMKTFI